MAVTLKLELDEGENLLALVRWLLVHEHRRRINERPRGCLKLSWGHDDVRGYLAGKDEDLGSLPRDLQPPRPIRRSRTPLFIKQPNSRQDSPDNAGS